MQCHLFKDYQYVKTMEFDSLLHAICHFQYHHGTTTQAMFTALNPVKGYAFSQWYQKEPNHKCSHGSMFKHEAGIPNPAPIPSFDELMTRVPRS